MEKDQDKLKYPTIEEFTAMSADDKFKLFISLPISAQKLLVGISAFASSVNPVMAQPVSRTSDEEFEEARAVLSKTPFFTQNETGRLDVTAPMREFINTDLREFWANQKLIFVPERTRFYGMKKDRK